MRLRELILEMKAITSATAAAANRLQRRTFNNNNQRMHIHIIYTIDFEDKRKRSDGASHKTNDDTKTP